MSNVVTLHDKRLAVEARQELNDAVESLTQAVKLLKMAGQEKLAARVSAHAHAIYALKLMSK